MASAWNEKLDQRIIALFPDHSCSEIARELGKDGHTFSRCAVQGRLTRLGVTVAAKNKVYTQTRDDLAPRSKLTGKKLPTGSTASGILSGIKSRQKHALKAEPFVCQDASDIEPIHIGLMDLTDDTCRWPYGDDAARMTFCGNHPFKPSPYCFAHFKLSVAVRTKSDNATEPAKVAA